MEAEDLELIMRSVSLKVIPINRLNYVTLLAYNLKCLAFKCGLSQLSLAWLFTPRTGLSPQTQSTVLTLQFVWKLVSTQMQST